MALILSIDASAERATVTLAENGLIVSERSNAEQKTHASWIHRAISECLGEAGVKPQHLSAVGLTSGPGSYTGLRVGMATAKGLCYAHDIPLVAVNTLLAIAYAERATKTDLICPMMDAGRMEVYAALYTRDMVEVQAPAAIILPEESFSDVLTSKTVNFLGSGKNKFEGICPFRNAFFSDLNFNASDFSVLIYTKFIQSEFVSLAYLEPLYLKEYRVRIN